VIFIIDFSIFCIVLGIKKVHIFGSFLMIKRNIIVGLFCLLFAQSASAATFNESDLFDAAASGNVKKLEFLLDVGEFDLATRDERGRTPLHHATMNGRRDTVAFLMPRFYKSKRKQDIRVKDNDGYNACQLAIKARKFWILKCFYSDYRRTYFLDDIKKILAEGFDINTVDRVNGMSLLHWMAYLGCYDVVTYLLQCDDIEVDKQDKNGCTALWLAVRFERYKMIPLFVAAGADVNLGNKDGNSALHMLTGALNESSILGCAFLLTAGANVEAENKFGHTPLDEVSTSQEHHLSMTHLFSFDELEVMRKVRCLMLSVKNKDESGISPWFNSLCNKFNKWIWGYPNDPQEVIESYQ
jgi:ankyrin repeat protein